MTKTPTSGDILRAFARTTMTAAARHVAEVIAAAISYDGRYRGAPRGYSAYTMAELREETGLSERSVSNALRELAALFGLVVVKRHHQRHFFRFARISQVAAQTEREHPQDSAPDTETGNRLPVPLYKEENKNNNFKPSIQIGAESNVHKTPWADWINRIKRGTPAEKLDAQYLWAGFCGLNRRNGHEKVPLAYLIGFLRKYPAAPSAHRAIAAKTAPPASPSAAPEIPPLVVMARAAPYENRHWHQSALIRLIGQPAYEARITELVRLHGGGRLTAQLAVHGQAVRAGEIDR